MSLSVALGNALSGLRSIETGLDTVSRNVSSAGVEGYARRTVSAVQNGPSGVRDGEVNRVLDTVLQRQMRRESAGAAYTATMARFLSRLDTSFGVPGGETALDTQVNRFTARMQALAAEPANSVARNEVLMAARLTAGTLNQLSADVQSLRAEAEAGLAGAVDQVNTALSTIDRIESQLSSVSGGNARADLMDERDRQVDALAQLMDIRVTPRGDGGIAIFTAGGTALFAGEASQLQFTPSATMTPNALYDSDPSKSGVGQLRIIDPQGAPIDLAAGPMQSGEIAALLTLRDETLVDAQSRLDAMAAGLARALSDKTVAGTAASSGAQAGFDLDLSGLSAGDRITLAVRGGGGIEKAFTFVRVDDPAALPLAGVSAGQADTLVGIDFSGGLAGAATQIQAALGSGYSVSSPAANTLRVLDDGAAGTTDVIAAEVARTITGVQTGEEALPLFVDAGNGVASRPFTGAFAGSAQQIGFAARIAVNPAVLSDPALLIKKDGAGAAGDPARPNALYDRLTNAGMNFVTIGGSVDGVFSGRMSDLVRTSLDRQAGAVAEAEGLNEGQQVVLSSLRERFSETSGVSVDEELARLVELQNAYSANARIISAVSEMLDALMRI